MLAVVAPQTISDFGTSVLMKTGSPISSRKDLSGGLTKHVLRSAVVTCDLVIRDAVAIPAILYRVLA